MNWLATIPLGWRLRLGPTLRIASPRPRLHRQVASRDGTVSWVELGGTLFAPQAAGQNQPCAQTALFRDAFRSTLSIVKEADLLLQIIDASDNIDDHIQTAHDVLQDLEAASIPVIKIFNKTDRITPTRVLLLEKLYPEAIFVSAIQEKHKKTENSADFVQKIRKQIMVFFEERMKTVKIRLDYQHCQQLANIYEWSRVDNIDYQEQGIMMTLTAIPRNLERLRHYLGSNITEMR